MSNPQFPTSNFYSIEWRTKAFVWGLSFFCMISVISYWFLVVGFHSLNKKDVKKEIKPNPFSAIEVEGKSAFVWDVINKRSLFEKNSDAPRPLASLTKVMTAITTAQIAPNLKEVTIKLSDLAPEGDSKLRPASAWEVKNLTDYMLLVSSNDAAHAMAASSILATRGDFIVEMNRMARQIGLTHSTFFNEHGLDNPPAGEVDGTDMSGAYGSARDMALLFDYALKNYPHILEATRYPDLKIKDAGDFIYPAENTNEIINLVPNPIASKTGYTTLAGGNLVIAFDAGLARPIVISVLGSTAEGRFTDVLKLVDGTMKYLQNE